MAIIGKLSKYKCASKTSLLMHEHLLIHRIMVSINSKTKLCPIEVMPKFKSIYILDGCIVWNAHNTVLGSKRLAIWATV